MAAHVKAHQCVSNYIKTNVFFNYQTKTKTSLFPEAKARDSMRFYSHIVNVIAQRQQVQCHKSTEETHRSVADSWRYILK